MRIASINVLNNNIHRRYPILKKELAKLDADVITLQECQEDEWLEDYHQVSSGYGSGELITLSKTPLEVIPSPEPNILMAKTTIHNTPVIVCNVHLSWGPNSEHSRLDSVTKIDKILEHRSEVVVLAGDFNANPDSRTIRFLKGLDFGSDGKSSTFWVDAWKEAGDESSEYTARYKDKWGRVTASRRGIKQFNQLPERRIDYIFVKGWVYGKTGYPLTFTKLDVESDHYGIMTELQVNEEK